ELARAHGRHELLDRRLGLTRTERARGDLPHERAQVHADRRELRTRVRGRPLDESAERSLEREEVSVVARRLRVEQDDRVVERRARAHELAEARQLLLERRPRTRADREGRALAGVDEAVS